MCSYGRTKAIIKEWKPKEVNRNEDFRTVVYPVKDINRVKKFFNDLSGTEQIMDQPYYVGFKVGDEDIDLVPNADNQGMTGSVAFYKVSDRKQSLKSLIEHGAQKLEDVKDVGDVKLVASVKDSEGFTIGLLQWP